MSILGRRLEKNPDWTKNDRTLVSVAPILLGLDVLLGAGGTFLRGGLAAIPLLVAHVAYVALVLGALWSGLPLVEVAAPEPKESVYRPGPRVAAIEQPPPSYTLMRVVLSLVVGLHALALVGAIVFGLLALVVLGLLWAVCSKH